MAAADARIRAFAAIGIGEAARVLCAQLIQRLRPMPARVTWVRPENLHLTLQFLGDVSADQIATFAAQLRPELALLSPFEATLRGVGVFPNPRRPSVIWAGFESANDEAAVIHPIVARAAGAIGLAPETRPFAPHVTLGRVRRESQKGGVLASLEPENPFNTDAFTVDAVSLFSSELTPQGARYTRLHRLTLDGLSRARGV
jgi:2'-5' RNA ligase